MKKIFKTDIDEDGFVIVSSLETNRKLAKYHMGYALL